MVRWTGIGVVTAVLTVPVLSADDKGKEPPKAGTDPAGAPLELKVVAKTTDYKLDLGGKSAEEFSKAVMDAERGGKLPTPPAVELTLELKNTGEKDVEVWAVGGDPVVLSLTLEGPGAVNVKGRQAFTREFRVPKPVTIAPGKAYTYELKSLAHGFRMAAEQAYWTEPGNYTLTAKLKTAVAPAPKGAKAAGDDGRFGEVTVTSEPVKLKVEKP
jgi:hypothetical protein